MTAATAKEQFKKLADLNFKIEAEVSRGNICLAWNSYYGVFCFTWGKARPEDAKDLQECITALKTLTDVNLQEEQEAWDKLQMSLAKEGIDEEVRPMVFREKKFEVKKPEEEVKKPEEKENE